MSIADINFPARWDSSFQQALTAGMHISQKAASGMCKAHREAAMKRIFFNYRTVIVLAFMLPSE